MRGLVADHPEDWEERLPFVECILRMVPLKALGGRSPFEVVTGLRPRLPAALNSAIPVGHVSISEYVGKLRDYFRESHSEIQRVQQAAVEDREEDVTGYLSKELEVGDIVLVRREATAGRKGPLRFQSRTYPQLPWCSKSPTGWSANRQSFGKDRIRNRNFFESKKKGNP